MNTRIKLSFAIAVCLLVATVATSLHLAQKAHALDRQADALQVSDLEQKKVVEAIEQLRAEIALVESQEPEPDEEPQTQDSSQPTLQSTPENSVLGDWLKRVERLSDFLRANPSLAIPEMGNLTPNDWLDVTKFRSIETDADFRIALAKLRQIAKMRQAEAIQHAFAQYLKDSDGELPADSSELLAYSNGAFDQTIIERYQINPSGKIPESPHASTLILVETDEFVDPLWNSRLTFRKDGIYGVHPSHEYKQSRIQDALQRFETEHGRAPLNSAELESLVSEEYRTNLSELLESITSPVELP
ncbi:hypothetical protein [Pelagicoccus sp. SDUM812003]|uniref:hypothetical protein n=1 Tax=Pelagicoccus sp. SDUM812003 TaxID=3041267 RepID=UPI00280DB04A|nr:hypothetical protein [Pelagicoccus sp. SDUM812003]MDQ8202242.1 hypothetical protein [Pelagicoccus sp. SDUM812003]